MAEKNYKDLSDAIKKATELQSKTGQMYLVGKDAKGSYFIQRPKDGSKYKKGGRVY